MLLCTCKLYLWACAYAQVKGHAFKIWILKPRICFWTASRQKAACIKNSLRPCDLWKPLKRVRKMDGLTSQVRQKMWLKTQFFFYLVHFVLSTGKRHEPAQQRKHGPTSPSRESQAFKTASYQTTCFCAAFKCTCELNEWYQNPMDSHYCGSAFSVWYRYSDVGIVLGFKGLWM